jgi:hypothetical protein
MKILKIIIAIPLLFLAGWIALLALYVVVLLLAGLIGIAHEGLFGSEADVDKKYFSQTYSITKSPTTRVIQVTELGFKKTLWG